MVNSNEAVCMCKEGSCVGLGQEGVVYVRVGETLWNTLKGVQIEKKGGETKILKGEGKLAQGVGTLERGGLEPSYKLWWPFDGFHEDFTLRPGVSLNSCEGSFQKFHLILILLQNLLKSFPNSGSLIFCWICAKSSLLSSI